MQQRLSCFTSFEVFVEEVFLALLVTGSGTTVIPRVAVRSLAVARELVIGPGKKYVDWFPYERTIERAHIFFRGGRPFSSILSPQRNTLNKAQMIRNAIAHRSRHSQKIFETLVIENTNLAPREYRPSAYLRGVVALLHESSLARTMPTDRILTCRCGMTLVGRGRSSD